MFKAQIEMNTKQKKQFKKTMKVRARRKSYVKKKDAYNYTQKKISKTRQERSVDFHRKYEKLGGLPKLIFFKHNLATQDQIAYHFGVVKETVRYWMAELFDETYDPRKDRREAKIAKLVEFIKKNGESKFNKRCKDESINKLYQETAIKQYHDTK